MIEFLREMLNLQKAIFGRVLALIIGAFKSLWFLITMGGVVIAGAMQFVFDMYFKITEFITAVDAMTSGASIQYPAEMVTAMRWANTWFPLQTMVDWTVVLFTALVLAYSIRGIKALIPTIS